MFNTPYKISKIGYEINKYSNHGYSVLEDIRLKYMSSNKLPNQEFTKELLEHLKLLKGFSKCDNFEDILETMYCSYNDSSKFHDDIMKVNNPYSFSKKICYLSKVLLRWIIRNNPPCSELSPVSSIYLDRCV